MALRQGGSLHFRGKLWVPVIPLLPPRVFLGFWVFFFHFEAVIAGVTI